ncbi:hypothetical protein GQ53DRAFT_854841 [Thozetella sp. PMI_491]|nr:hypothetical protein GQ53DRAFT_854841 [Thozetella sp. PMI_491]
MKHLAISPVERVGPGYRLPPGLDQSSLWAYPIFYFERLKRATNKLLLRPATLEVRIMAGMVSQLRAAAEDRLRHQVKRAALSSPYRVALTWEEIDDVFDFLWMTNLFRKEKSSAPEPQYTTRAAYAAYGYGLCENYTNTYACAKEEESYQWQQTLHIDFGVESLSGTLGRFRTARKQYPDRAFVSPSLGFRRVQTTQDFRETEAFATAIEWEHEYWEEVRVRIREFIAECTPHRPLDVLLLSGEHASNPRFKAALRHALEESERATPSVIAALENRERQIGEDEYFLYATSLGMAELAKRRQEGSAECLLPIECRDGRQQGETRRRSEEL